MKNIQIDDLRSLVEDDDDACCCCDGDVIHCDCLSPNHSKDLIMGISLIVVGTAALTALFLFNHK